MALTDHEISELTRIMGRHLSDVEAPTSVCVNQMISDKCLEIVDSVYLATEKGQILVSDWALRKAGQATAYDFANTLLNRGRPELFVFEYTNYRGEKATRRVIPEAICWGSTEWHKEPCMLLKAYDVSKADHRDFKIADIDLEYLTRKDV